MSHSIRVPEDAPKVVELFRMGYDGARTAVDRRREKEAWKVAP